MSIASNFEEVVSAFTKFHVEFMIAGGYAVNFHGYNRSTSDLDIWIKPINENKEKIMNALIHLGFSRDDTNKVQELNFTKPFTFKLGTDPIDVDIFNYISGVAYHDAEKNMIRYQYADNLFINFISVRDLVVNKMIAGRPIDKIDIDYLQKIEQLKKT